MARLTGADCGANLMERSYVLNGAGFTLVAKSNANGRSWCAPPRYFPALPRDDGFEDVAVASRPCVDFGRLAGGRLRLAHTEPPFRASAVRK